MLHPHLPDIYSFFSTVQNYCGLSVYIRHSSCGYVTLVDLDQVGKVLGDGITCMEKEILSEAEQLYFKRFKYLKRRKEWLGGRIAAKVALLTFAKPAQCGMRRLTILPDEYGRPVAEGLADGMGDLSFSISHGDRYAVALAEPGNSCGIDLQKISKKLSSLTDHFASEKELALLACQSGDKGQDLWLTMLWTVKESLKKSILHSKSVIFSATEVEEITFVREHVYRFNCTVQGQPQSAVVYNLFPYILSMSQADHFFALPEVKLSGMGDLAGRYLS
jgi:4'-phosphopantetheinyl transferase EntD